MQAALRQPAPSYRQRLTVRQPNNSFYLLPAADIAFLQADEGVVFATDQRGYATPWPAPSPSGSSSSTPPIFSGSTVAS
ncbi:MAG: hypothetical protein WKG07_29965 [Hymenobacter sp.]